MRSAFPDPLSDGSRADVSGRSSAGADALAPFLPSALLQPGERLPVVVLRRAGASNIPAALRHCARYAEKALRLLGL